MCLCSSIVLHRHRLDSEPYKKNSQFTYTMYAHTITPHFLYHLPQMPLNAWQAVPCPPQYMVWYTIKPPCHRLEFCNLYHRCTDTSDPGHFGPKTLRTYESSDPGHFGMTEVSGHFGTGAEVSYGHFGTTSAPVPKCL